MIRGGGGVGRITNISISPPKPNKIFKKALKAFYLLTSSFESYHKGLNVNEQIEQKLKDKSFDCIIVFALNEFSLAHRIKKNAKIIFDVTDWWFDQKGKNPNITIRHKMSSLLFNKYSAYMCNTYIPKMDALSANSKSMAELHKKHFNLKYPTMHFPNTIPYENIKVKELKQGDKIKIIFHGVACGDRRIEKMIDLASFLDERFELYFILVGFKEYQKELKQRGSIYKNVFFKEPVSNKDIATYTSQFDIGLPLLSNQNPNMDMYLPYKLFQLIQSRLAIATGPGKEIVPIIKKYDLGVIGDDFEPENLAYKLNNLTYEQINKYKQNSNIAAKELKRENNYKTCQDFIAELITT